jgi:hypothetical protein
MYQSFLVGHVKLETFSVRPVIPIPGAPIFNDIKAIRFKVYFTKIGTRLYPG